MFFQSITFINTLQLLIPLCNQHYYSFIIIIIFIIIIFRERACGSGVGKG